MSTSKSPAKPRPPPPASSSSTPHPKPSTSSLLQRRPHGTDTSTTAAIASSSRLPPQPSSTTQPEPLTDEQLVEVRAAQRTFEGAYVRTSLGQFSFALVVLRIFTNEFYGIGALFAAYGAGIMAIALYRRHQGNSQFFLEEVTRVHVAEGRMGEGDGGVEVVSRFRTSGNVVIVMTALSLVMYCILLYLILRLD